MSFVLEREIYFGQFRPQQKFPHLCFISHYHSFNITSNQLHRIIHREILIWLIPIFEILDLEIWDITIDDLRWKHTRRVKKWYKDADRTNHKSRSTGPIYEFFTSFYAQLSWLSESAKTSFLTYAIVIQISTLPVIFERKDKANNY